MSGRDDAIASLQIALTDGEIERSERHCTPRAEHQGISGPREETARITAGVPGYEYARC